MKSQLKQQQVKISTNNATAIISTVHCSMDFRWITFLGEHTTAFSWLVKSYVSATDFLYSSEPHIFYYQTVQGNAAIVWLTSWRRNYFLILAHPVYKMWKIQEPKALDLWNKLHFEEEKTESIYHV